VTLGELRDRASHDHQAIRERLARVDAASAALAGGDAGRWPALARELEELRRQVASHLRWEDGALLAALSHAGARGAARAERLRSVHAELHAVLAFCERSWSRLRDPRLRARRAHDLASLLRDEIRAEEEPC
jgi:hypothetical protein